MAKIGGVIPTPLREVIFTEEDLSRSRDWAKCGGRGRRRIFRRGKRSRS